MLSASFLFHLISWWILLLVYHPCAGSSSVKHKLGTNGKHNWQSLLRDAAFQSLSKYTGFTASLDDKLERDAILWEKIHSARFLRKNKYDYSESVKIGVLVDMSSENGDFEFRQSDKSIYGCPGPRCRPIDDSLLAVWKTQNYGPNSIWIKIKIPLTPPVEDIYEYTPRYGLKQINHRDPSIVEAVDELKPEGSKEEKAHTNAQEAVNRQDHNVYQTNYENQNQFYNPYQIVRYQVPNQPPLAYVHPHWSANQGPKARVKNEFVPPERPFPPKHTNWALEFQPNSGHYDGFIPSVGPLASPVYKSTPTYKHPVDNAKFIHEYRETLKQYFHHDDPPADFKPSTEYVHFSEPDPFYHGPGYLPDATTPSNQLNQYTTHSSGTSENKYPNHQKTIQATTTVEVEKSAPYVTTIVTKKMPNTTFKGSDTVINLGENDKLLLEIHAPAEIITGSSTTTEKAQSTTFKNKVRQRLPVTALQRQRPTKIADNNYDYTTHYLKWGERIKTSTEKPTLPTKSEGNKLFTSTSTTQSPELSTTSPVGVSEETNISEHNTGTNLTSSEYDYPLSEEDTSIEKNPTESSEEESTTISTISKLTDFDKYNDSSKGEPGTTEKRSTNIQFESLENKSPEEIVSELTSMGLRNHSAEISNEQSSDESSDQILSGSSNLGKSSEDVLDSRNIERREPVSVVVNRISQSYSYKTAIGHTGRLKHTKDQHSTTKL